MFLDELFFCTLVGFITFSHVLSLVIYTPVYRIVYNYCLNVDSYYVAGDAVNINYE